MEPLALGVLGGMGPQATVDFLQNILDQTGAARDREHLRMHVDFHPQIPDRIAAVLGGGIEPTPAMQQSLAILCQAGARVIAMPCVSAHFFLPRLQIPADVQFLNMLEIAASACAQRKPGQRVGILASVATAESAMMQQACAAAQVPYCLPQHEDQQTLGELILWVKARRIQQAVAPFEAICQRLAAAGADYFLLACTELPLIAAAASTDRCFVNATTELARAAIRACGYPLAEDIS